MRTFRAEYAIDYSSYSFGYASYAVSDVPGDLAEVYGAGYLPYTADLELTTQVFYLARSLRVDLDRFSDSSENRRVARKAAELQIEPMVHTVANFDLADADFLRFCERYADERFSGGAMPPERLKYLLQGPLLTHIIEFRSTTKVFGYVFAVMTEDFLHYWFSFFDTAYLRSHSLGKWMMWRSIRLAADIDLKHVYLGTCYGNKGLYKARDYKGVAFFDGMTWNPNLVILKQLAHGDDEPREAAGDLFKSRHVPELAALFAPYVGLND